MDAINRRDAIHRMAALLGGTLSAPIVAGLLSGCQPSDSADWAPHTLTAHQNELVTVLSERIIPATDTPGAAAAQVNRFIDLMLTDWYPDDEVARFVDALDELDERAEQLLGTPVLQAPNEQQDELLAALADEARQADPPPTPFFSMLKELTMVGYYNSEIGQNEELEYRTVPGRYDGCVPVEDVYPHLDAASTA